MSIADTLQQARRALIDLSTRNRLLSLPAQGRSRGVVRIADEDAGVVLAQLGEGKAFGFEAAQAGESKVRRRADGVATASATATREEWQHDTNLRVALTPDELTRRLRDVMADARTAREETGVASLYLAIGGLVWRDPETPGTERMAPLALIPATLEREGVSNRFRLRGNPEEMVENLSLREKLGTDFRIALPEFDAAGWSAKVATAIAGREGWRVDPHALALGLFAFAKFLMWRDLDPVANPGLLQHATLLRLLDPVAPPPEAPPFADDADVDAAIPVERLDHVVEVDGSQALAAEAVRRGGSLVIQGPPGTGKSQTIVNIMAQAVLDGRSVLFVAEKAAALEVVKRRLETFGLGAAVLELHSEKQSKRAVLDELRATLALPPPAVPQREAAVQRLGDLRGRLNRHAAAMRDQVGETGVTVQEVIGRLAALRAGGATPPPFTLDAAGWDAAHLRALRDSARDLAANSGGARSPWRGVSAGLDAIGATRFQSELPRHIRALAAAPGGIAEAERALAAEALRAEAPMQPADVDAAKGRLADLRHLAAATHEPRFLPGALDLPGLAAARGTLAQPGGVFGFLDGARREARAVLAAALRNPDDAGALEALLAAQAAKARLGTGGPDADAIARALGWMEQHRDAFATPPATPAMREALAAWSTIHELTGLDAAGSFTEVAEHLAAMADEPEALAPWQGWARAVAAEPALAPLAQALESGALPPETAEAALDFAMLEALLRVALRQHPELAAFDGAAADRLVADFRNADAARVRLARSEAAAKHAERLVALRNGEEAASLAFLRGEFERKRGHAPLRTLMTRAAPLIRKAKPILMLSPLTVAQFLASPHHATLPGFPVFDLLVMDEASQIEPVDALGAIARAKQIVVVGDDKQMPPTRFFQRMTEDDAEAPEEDSTLDARDVESILGLANARGIPNAMLRWHYRSRHESLIATSNAEFYGNRLLVLPSPRPRSAALGLSLVRVDGRFTASANAAEAQAVAEAVMRHARETPGETLGVAAFSVTQRDAILDAVEKLRRTSPQTEPFFNANPAEPFFVKNLENVQGDERDAILISVGYGRDANNRLAMRFGPLSAEGGERRLNVLITRAKRRCVVFSGIGAEEVDLERAKGQGVAALKAFLAYAAGADTARVQTGEASPIAGLIGGLITQSGREAVPHVGLSGLFLDMAARGPDGFELGVEVDGGDWANLRCARDRDRGRQMALEGLGWSLTRSWSLDWLNQPEAARARLRAPLGLAAPQAPAVTADPGLGKPYREATMDKPPANRAELAQLIAGIIATEAPVHPDAIVGRLALLLGPAAPDAKTFAAALNEARLLHGAHEANGFWFAEESGPIAPRNRHGCAPYLRRPAMIHPDEVAAAARLLLGVQPQATEEELAAGIARLLGLEASAAPAMAARLAMLLGSGQVILAAGNDRLRQ
ncbi:MAG: damage-inducible protein [Rubritepida sp.]|nr:damage-inducible protein [Rubritepida sp.]